MKTTIMAATALIGACAGGSAAHAALVINVAQSGTNVVARADGSISLTGLTANRALATNTRISGTLPAVNFRGDAATVIGYTGFTGPESFGPGGSTTATSVTGSTSLTFSVPPAVGFLLVGLPVDYVSGSSISATATYADQTIATLGLTVGQYVFRSSADTITVNIVDPVVVPPVTGAVPEPATWGMMLVGFGMIGFGMRRRSKVRTTVRFA